MTDTDMMLVCTRLADMTVMHPQQDDSHICCKCGHPVGIYPTGMRALQKYPEMTISCINCVDKTEFLQRSEIIAAGPLDEVVQEARESKPVIKQ